MKQTIIICGGSKYIDIDVLACSVAYAEWFQDTTNNPRVVLCGEFNETIPKTLRKNYTHLKDQTFSNEIIFSFILVDVSNPNFFPAFVKNDKISEIWDHHFGYEKHWQKKLDQNAHIEPVGACATLIWEQFIKYQKENQISKESAQLLSFAILSNTLNLQAKVTTPRDIQALEQLQNHAHLPNDWIETYYQDTEKSILSNPRTALIHDKKTLDIHGEIISIGQLELWSVSELLKNHDLVSLAENILSPGSDHWFLNMPCISENKNYLITKSKSAQQKLSKICGATFKNNIGTTTQLFLRKEIVREFKS